MNDVLSELLLTIARTTLWLSAAGLATAIGLRLSRASGPTTHRSGWVLTLLVGWTFVGWPVAVPWYENGPGNAAVIAAADESLLVSPSIVVENGDGRRHETPVDEPSEGVLPATDFAAIPASTPSTYTPAAAARTGQFHWPRIAMAFWALGIVVLTASWLAGYLRFICSLPPALPVDQDWERSWRELQATQDVRHPIRLRVTAELGPMLCLLPRGYQLFVPEDFWNELDTSEREAILRHELAHYLRGDVWKSLLVRVLALPHWFNPLSWWAVRRFDEAAEWACDRAATVESPPTTYAKTLLRLGQVASPCRAYGSAARGRQLAARIRHLLTSRTTEDSIMKKTLLVAAGLCLLAFALVRVQLVAREPNETAPPLEPGTTYSQPKNLLYDGKDFEYWSNLLQTDLSPDRQRTAVFALAAFAANGYGRQATAEIFKAMHGYSVWEIDGSSEGQLKAVAKQVFKNIPPDQALPAVLEALKSGNANQRLFALAVLPRATAHLKDVEPIFAESLQDEDARVRQFAIAGLAALNSSAPGLVPAMRSALASDDHDIVRGNIAFAAGVGFHARGFPLSTVGPKPMPALAPELVALLGSDDASLVTAAIEGLVHMGQPALPALQKALESPNAKVAKTVREIVERIHGSAEAVERR